MCKGVLQSGEPERRDGNEKEDEFEKKDELKMKQYAFMKAFLEKYPSLNCRELLASGNGDVSEVMFTLCPAICRDTMVMLKELEA